MLDSNPLFLLLLQLLDEMHSGLQRDTNYILRIIIGIISSQRERARSDTVEVEVTALQALVITCKD